MFLHPVRQLKHLLLEQMRNPNNKKDININTLVPHNVLYIYKQNGGGFALLSFPCHWSVSVDF